MRTAGSGFALGTGSFNQQVQYRAVRRAQRAAVGEEALGLGVLSQKKRNETSAGVRDCIVGVESQMPGAVGTDGSQVAPDVLEQPAQDKAGSFLPVDVERLLVIFEQPRGLALVVTGIAPRHVGATAPRRTRRLSGE
jgi:hypothetical protein